MKSSAAKQLLLILIALIVIGISFGMGFSFGLQAGPEIEKITVLDNKELEKPPTINFAPFWKVWNVLNEKYVSSATTTSNEDRVWGAIEGLAASLNDPYTVFFPPENNKLFASEISGSFEGVGMEIGIKNDVITVIAPLKDTPAAKAGILSGDKILKIDDRQTFGMKVEEAIRHIRGKKGTEVVFSLLRENNKEPIEVKVIRGTIDIPTIDTDFKHMILSQKDATPEGLQQSGIFTIRLYSFTEKSPNLFRDAIRKFIEAGTDKLIIDLRGNPGGYLAAAVDMASWFLPAGKVVVSEDFGKNSPPVVYRTHRDAVFNKNLKLVILVDGGSASASEILAGALQEYGIAKLVGTPTFGKGVVQELINITPETSLKVTVARWLTPNGKSLSQKGIIPDVEVKMTQEDVTKKKDPQMEAAVKLLMQ
ncbi:MAG: Carboxyl-terminal protease [Parcubacteria group bacterium GW2011_GWA2_47_16]|nr:MAG: Carboxyl-terminal protease [Parcubacteria group bacterium GW2011_GWA2_47_16]